VYGIFFLKAKKYLASNIAKLAVVVAILLIAVAVAYGG